METFSICGGVVCAPLMILGWVLLCRRIGIEKRFLWVGVILICLPFALGAVSLSKFMFIDEPLRSACYDGNLPEVKRYLALGASINLEDDGMTPLGAAIANGHEEVAIYLLEHGANADESTLLRDAEVRKLPKLVRALEARRAR